MMVKICGITNPEDALAAVREGASALGFNFYPKSPRYVSMDDASGLVDALPPEVLKVGVFVNAEPDGILATMTSLGLDVAQIHGDAHAPQGVRVWRAVSVDESFDVLSLEALAGEAFLLDAPAGAVYGGTGRTFDWTLAAGATRRIILAGGLDATNVRQAIQAAKPWGVDACSRLEKAPGRKDHAKMAAFLEAALSEGPC